MIADLCYLTITTTFRLNFDTPRAPENRQDGAKEAPSTSQDVGHSSDPLLLLPVAHGRAIVVRFLAGFACPQHIVVAPARSVPQSATYDQPLMAGNGVLRLKKVFSLKFSAAFDLRPQLVPCSLLVNEASNMCVQSS